MAETLTENQTCANCGVEVRPNSMFCYNCGSDVAAASPRENGHAAGVNFTPAQETAAQTTKLELPPVEKNKTSEAIEKKPEIENAKNAAAVEEPKLKSAAAMRRQPKSYQQKQVEVVWEEPAGDSLLRLFLVTLLLLVFVGAIIYFGVYSK